MQERDSIAVVLEELGTGQQVVGKVADSLRDPMKKIIVRAAVRPLVRRALRLFNR